jgi:hypothetical protein
VKGKSNQMLATSIVRKKLQEWKKEIPETTMVFNWKNQFDFSKEEKERF